MVNHIQLSQATSKKADAILLGAVGGPKWDTIERSIRPERGLLKIRSELNLFANLRPAILYPQLADASSLNQKSLLVWIF
jgi:3-isopropylmalate dehydrogenase